MDQDLWITILLKNQILYIIYVIKIDKSKGFHITCRLRERIRS
jgi:hypothetical protein